jgi:hypothetical protein
MKRLHQYILLLGSILGLSSCSDFLEVYPLGKTTIPVFFSDMDGIRSAIPGLYSKVYTYYTGEFYFYPDVAGNMVSLPVISSDAKMVNQYNFTSDPEQETTAVGKIWLDIFTAIANANNILTSLPSLKENYPQHLKELERYEAEALFIRALGNFDLVRVYAQPYNYTTNALHPGIPLLRKSPGPDDNPKRATVKAIYDFIEEDLLLAEKQFGDQPMTSAWFASKKAVQALLARVYLYRENWTEAIKYATYVIDAKALDQGRNYLKIYSDMATGNECLFRLNGHLKSKSLGAFYDYTAPSVLAADTLMTLFNDTTDLRAGLFRNTKNGQGKVSTKYLVTSTTVEEDIHYDPLVLRLAEQYLIRAEAYVHQARFDLAAADVKQIRGRALQVDPGSLTLTEDSTSVAGAIELERIKEFCFEGQHFFDITRRKQNLVRGSTTNSTVKHLAYPNDLFVLPISQKELNANKNMTGNPTVNK